MRKSAFAAALLLTVIAPPALSETTYDAAMTLIGMNISNDYPVTDDFVYVLGRNEYTKITTDDPSNPMNGATAMCFGKLEIRAGDMTGSGYCLLDDTSGERAVTEWSTVGPADDGRFVYDWSLVGGSGKWVGATGGGQVAQALDQETGTITSEQSGSFTLK